MDDAWSNPDLSDPDYGADAPLTAEQRSFAEEHHNLLFSFMDRYGLNEDCYDRLAIRFLRTVVRYLADGSLREYAFSTVLWYHLRSELTDILRDIRQRPAEVEFEQLPAWEPAYEETIDALLWRQIEQELTFKQCEAVYLRNQGYKNREIAELCGVRPKAIEKRFGRIRKNLKKMRF